eukprot:COSAG01_NODE_43060_length_433_cov_2.568862_1_plen_57_part_10
MSLLNPKELVLSLLQFVLLVATLLAPPCCPVPGTGLTYAARVKRFRKWGSIHVFFTG